MGDFLASLSSVRLDRFVRVLGSFETRGSQASIGRLELSLSQVRGELSKINEARDALRLRKEDLAGVIQDLDTATDENPSTPDVLLLKLVLLDMDAELEAAIAESRPDALHKRKAHLRAEIARRRLLSKLARMIEVSARTPSGHTS